MPLVDIHSDKDTVISVTEQKKYMGGKNGIFAGQN